jgi:peptidoglycan hydrolase-like protein with peptidoglycan-binding domain
LSSIRSALAARRAVAGAVALIAVLAVPATAQAKRYHLGDRTLKMGMHGTDVRVLQDYLSVVGIDTSVDGQFGAGTKKSVKAWERQATLKANGVVTRSDAQVLIHSVATAGAAKPGNDGGAVAGPLIGPPTGKVTLNSDGTATAPADAPLAIQQVVAAGNRIAHLPYIYGGGHGRWTDRGYDCSGSVSFALHGGGLIKTQMDSTDLESYGDPGPGQWITIYANAGHAFMIVGGLRFDTSGLSQDGSRWHKTSRPTSGYVVRHPTGF